MLRLTNLLKSRRAWYGNLLAGKVNNATDVLRRHIFTSQAENRSSKIFADYTIFKGKAALSSSPIFPKAEVNSRYGKKGCILLTFWPAIGERKYDWEKRQIFALSPTELGSLISLERGMSCEFFHDPFMKSSNAGQVRKSLSVTPLGDESGYFFTLTVVNNTLKTNDRLSVPVNKAEYTVMRTTFSYILPHIMGWNQVTEQVRASGGAYPARQQEMRASESAFPVRQQEMRACESAFPVRQQEMRACESVLPTRQVEMRMSPNLEWDR